jgi:hypothetical protein
LLAQGESHIPGRSQEQKGKKRKNDFGKHGKGFKVKNTLLFLSYLKLK